jgi:hypothetical protein
MSENVSDLIGKKDVIEYILCSAIWVDDENKYTHQPKNIYSGYVICGRRHHNCFTTMQIFKELNKFDWDKKDVIQGFLTNEDRFVDRKEGAEIAFKSKQIDIERNNLISEHLW